ncbi:MAG: substrate-binding domain-containing protein [Bifidobacteriaceae bacterium]|jgi:DNA-binding LacI/PurR family transcriptional regulator|nr:substrate-binding domain-containing protein [Bifidobacteriaceae bacterium]
MPGTNSTPPRGADVALAAGVSQKTVSRVFRGESYVSDAVRARVMAAAEELGYRINSAARALASGRTHTVGTVALESDLFGPTSLLVGIERAARNAGFALQIAITSDGEEGGIRRAVDALLERGVDGIIVAEAIDEDSGVIAVDVPVLVFGGTARFESPLLVGVDIGSRSVVAHAVTRLLDLGHPTVHHLAGPANWVSSKERLAGWRDAVESRGAAAPEVFLGDWSAASGFICGREVAARDDVSAVFAANDEMAIGLIHALRESGRSVPGDVSVMGFDDIPLAAHVDPPLTTIRQDLGLFAIEAVAEFIVVIEGGQPRPNPVARMPVELIERSSTGPPNSKRQAGLKQ